jgi:hypothetical protein
VAVHVEHDAVAAGLGEDDRPAGIHFMNIDCLDIDIDEDRFYEYPFRTKTFRINFQPQVLDKFTPKNNRYKFI